LLTRLRDTLADPQLGAAAAARLRGRYQVVLVDEFQDTDPVQWEILRLAFHGAVTLVLIGDPKQAIYAFRGADVLAYLDAAAVAGARATLAQNWRSDAALLCGLDALFRGAALGDERIVVLPVSAAHAGRSLASDEAPVRLRVVTSGGTSGVPVDEMRRLVTADVVAEVVALLDSGAVLTPRDGTPARPVQPADIAVIVRTGGQLELVHAALLAAGVPAVQRTTSSVFRTAAATDWIVLLEALEQPHRAGRVRRLALSAFVGWDAARLDAEDSDQLGVRLRGWLQILEQRGIAALFEAVSRSEGVAARLLGQLDGERRLTDLRHVGEALHAAAMEGQLGLTATLEWLRRRVEESTEDSAQERSRRLDSDEAAVQVVTIHASKGLEFPVVHVPFAWDRFVFEPDIPLFHDDTGRRVRDVGGGGPGFAANKSRHKVEEYGEDLRLLYVALTRAQAQVTAWWAPNKKNTPCAPLHRLLFTEDPAADVPAPVTVPGDDVAVARLQRRAVDGCLSVTVVEPRPAAAWTPSTDGTSALAAAAFGRTVDLTWRRTSYSALTSALHEGAPRVGSEPEFDPENDEPPTLPDAVTAGGEDALRGVPSPMDALPAGTAFGILVHSVLEQTDPTAADLAAELKAQAGEQLHRQSIPGLTAAALAESLLPSVRTPLGRIAQGLSLADITPADRLPELDFELPLCGGDRPVGLARLGDLVPVLRAHLAADDPMSAYADRLADPLLAAAPLRGYLSGSIDAVLRVGGRYLVVDYKTNRLAPHDEPLTAWHYRAPALVDAMLDAHYPLQALLYDVALHRFLRWRLPGYDPAEHLGGVLYLFLRGMCGPGVVAADGSVPGVFAWQPPAALVVALSDLLAKGSA
ncbi:MAG TPA: UvrD-helicase domain-containing protein, partial [Mycobacteriales bacterium]|nr:UvrD-helicase domain-containing protein [Mycobacteriales bacterium]